MANRAYLYASDSSDDNAWVLPDDSEYYDSRWTIPFAWWFLLGPDDATLVDIHFGDSTWQALRFVADRLAALDRLERRRGLLDEIVRNHLDLRHIENFTAVLSAWQGRYLLIDTDEILEDDPEYDMARILPILKDLEHGNPATGDVLNGLSHYSSIEPNDLYSAEVMIVGCAYGPIAGRLREETMAEE